MNRLTIILLLFTILGCNKDELPKESQEGKDSFGMLVNGVVWIPYNPSEIGPGNHKPFSVYYPDCGTIEIYAEGEGYIYFTAQVKDVGKYCMNSSFSQITNCIPDSLEKYIDDLSSYRTRFIDSTFYYLTDSLKSELEITAFDTSKQIVSGKFEMTLFSEDNQKLQITNGIFDINYKTY